MKFALNARMEEVAVGSGRAQTVLEAVFMGTEILVIGLLFMEESPPPPPPNPVPIGAL